MTVKSRMIHYIINSPRPFKRLVSVLFDAIVIPTCIILALWTEHGNDLISNRQIVGSSLVTIFISIWVFKKLGLYHAILRYLGIATISVLIIGVSISSLTYGLSYWFISKQFSITQFLFYWCFLTISIGGSRLFVKAYIESRIKVATNVAIYGAGSAGRQLASALRQGNRYRPVFFIDDDENLSKSKIDGLEVLLPIRLRESIRKNSITHILLALPSVTHLRRSEILTALEPYPVKVKTIAGMEDIVNGKVNIAEVKDIEIEDLLGRDSVEPDFSLLSECIYNKVVMVTGAGGSIGSELCRQIIALAPTSIVLYELSEFALYSIEKELRKLCKAQSLETQIIPLLGSVQHKNRLVSAMELYRVQTVYHAAAYKHVPIVEHNVVEGVRNNVFGTWYAAEAAAATGVERFVLVSTDKAVRSTNIMGASKRVAELVLQAMNTRDVETVFTMVRFGNVLGSSGSVVPLFRDQIKAGGPVTVTHKDIIRYFMTIPEAAQLVIQAGAMGKGGDVFVLDMGEQVKISELAERMIHLMGSSVKNSTNPQGDIEIHYSGLRPGEKLYEELLVGENVVGTNHPKIMTANEELLPWHDMQRALILLNELCEDMDCEGIVQLLLKIPTGYNPQHAVCDLLWDDDKDKNNVLRFKTLS